MPTFEFRPMEPADYPEAMSLWLATEGLGLSDADSEPAIRRYLERNPGLSFVAQEGDRLVGTVLCGHDGRRGYLHHLAVATSHRGSGLGRGLTARCLEALRVEGVTKCHLFVRRTNAAAPGFWGHHGWQERTDLAMFSRELGATGGTSDGPAEDSGVR